MIAPDRRAEQWKRTERAYKRRIQALESALRGCSHWEDVPDSENCWCAGLKCEGSVACVDARNALRLARPPDVTTDAG